MAYGIKVQPTWDPYVELAENTLGNFTKNLLPGTFLADTFYWLRYIPEGLPGTGWKAKVRQMQREMHDLLDKPFDAAMKAIVSLPP